MKKKKKPPAVTLGALGGAGRKPNDYASIRVV